MVSFSNLSSIFRRTAPAGSSAQVQIKTVVESATDLRVSSESTTTFVAPSTIYPSSVQVQEDMMAEFFGARPQKHRAHETVPPPYTTTQVDVERLASLQGNVDDEPITLARFMFKYGFLFPPFWIMGIIILCTPLRSTPEFEQGKTEEEKTRILAEMREVEVKWGKRCLVAVLSLVGIVAVIVLAVVLARLHHH